MHRSSSQAAGSSGGSSGRSLRMRFARVPRSLSMPIASVRCTFLLPSVHVRTTGVRLRHTRSVICIVRSVCAVSLKHRQASRQQGPPNPGDDFRAVLLDRPWGAKSNDPLWHEHCRSILTFSEGSSSAWIGMDVDAIMTCRVKILRARPVFPIT